MSIRRAFYSQEPEVYTDELKQYEANHNNKLGWGAAMTPRKWRTIYNSNAFQPTVLYNRHEYSPPNTNEMHEWIGKTFVPVDTVNMLRPADTLLEYDVMRKAGMYTYRILYAVPYDKAHGYYPKPGENKKYIVKSKASVEGRPGQLNLILDTSNKILDVQYW